MSKKVWLITGAGRGMGVEFARAALASGHAVVASGRDRERVSKVLGTSSDLRAVTLDVTSAADAEAAVRAGVDRFGRIDVLVNNGLEVLAKHPRVDSTRIGLLGNSRGGVSSLYAGMKRFQRMYAPVDAQFAVYLSLYPPCSKRYIDDTGVVDRPIRLFNGTADEIAPIRQCLSYVKRLQDAGKDAQVPEPAGAVHGFDGPGTALTRVRVGDSD